MGEEVRSFHAPVDALPVHAAVVQVGHGLQGAPHLVGTVGDAQQIGALGPALLEQGELLLGEVRQPDEAVDPPLHRGRPTQQSEVEPVRRLRALRGWAGAADQATAGIALVPCQVGVALRQYKVTEVEVPGELRAGAGCAGHNQAAVPAVRDAEHEAAVAVQGPTELVAGHGLTRLPRGWRGRGDLQRIGVQSLAFGGQIRQVSEQVFYLMGVQFHPRQRRYWARGLGQRGGCAQLGGEHIDRHPILPHGSWERGRKHRKARISVAAFLGRTSRGACTRAVPGYAASPHCAGQPGCAEEACEGS